MSVSVLQSGVADTLYADAVVGKSIQAVSGGPGGVDGSLQIKSNDGRTEVINCPIQGGNLTAQDYIVVPAWASSAAYGQGSLVSYSGSNWLRTAAGNSVPGVAPAGPDWVQKGVGSVYQQSTITKDTLETSFTGPILSWNTNPQGVGMSSEWTDVAAVVGPPAIPAYANHQAVVRQNLLITSPAPVAATAGFDSVLTLQSTSLSAGNPGSAFDFYCGVGNPGGGAPANALSLYGYPSGGGTQALLVSTPAVDVPGHTWGADTTNPALLQITAPQQSGVAQLPAGGPSIAVAYPAITANSLVLATLLGGTPVPISVQTNAGVGFTIFGAPAGAEDVVWFIIRL